MTRPSMTDGVLALVLTAAGLAEAVLGLTSHPEPWYVVLTVPVATAAVWLRRCRPPAAVSAMLAAFLAQAMAGSDLPGGFTEPVVLVLVTYAVGSRVPGRRGA